MSFPGPRSWETEGLALTAVPTFEVRFTPTRTRAAAIITNTRRIRRLQRGVAAETSPGPGNANRHDRTFATATEWCRPRESRSPLVTRLGPHRIVTGGAVPERATKPGVAQCAATNRSRRQPGGYCGALTGTTGRVALRETIRETLPSTAETNPPWAC